MSTDIAGGRCIDCQSHLEWASDVSLETRIGQLQDLNRKVFELASLLNAGQAMSSILDPDHLYAVYIGIVREKLAVCHLALYLYNDTSSDFELATKLGLADIPERFQCEEGLLWQNVLQGAPFPVLDIFGCPLYAEFFGKNNLHQLCSDLWIPMVRLGQIVGLLTVGRREDRLYSSDDISFLKQLSTQVSHSLNMCYLYQRSIREKEELDKTLRNLSLLYNINKAMTYIHDLKNLLRYILKQAVDIAKAEKGSIMLYDSEDGQLHIRVMEGIQDRDFLEKVNNQEVKTQSFKPGEGIAGQVFETGQPVFSNNIGHDVRFVQAGKSFVSSIACVPMVVFGDVIGVINVTNKRDQGGFTAEDEELLKAIADQAAVAINKAQLWEMAVTDSLTGLYIRRFFLARFNEEMRRAERYGRVFSIIMCDIDHFKRVNDTHGHHTGDRVLQAVAAYFQKTVRQVDIVARYGGEEFVMLLPETDKTKGALLANRLREGIAALEFGELEGITISMGVAAYPDDSSDMEELIKKADAALYKAKTSGRGRVVEYDPSIPMTPQKIHHEYAEESV